MEAAVEFESVEKDRGCTHACLHCREFSDVSGVFSALVGTGLGLNVGIRRVALLCLEVEDGGLSRGALSHEHRHLQFY